MKKVKIESKYGVDEGLPLVFNPKYTYAPNQIVLFRFYEYDNEDIPLNERNYIDVPGLIRTISFDEEYGSPVPLADVDVFNYWRDGTLSGTQSYTLIPHRYESPKPLEQKHIDLIGYIYEVSGLDHIKSPFYVVKEEDNHYKIYPFKE